MAQKKDSQIPQILRVEDIAEEKIANQKIAENFTKLFANLTKLASKVAAGREMDKSHYAHSKLTKAIDDAYKESDDYRKELKSMEELSKGHRDKNLLQRNIQFVQDQDRSAFRFIEMKKLFTDTLNLSQMGISSENFGEIEGTLQARGDEGLKKLQGIVGAMEAAMEENREIKTSQADDEVETEYNEKKEQLTNGATIESKDVEAVENLVQESRNEISRLREEKLQKNKSSMPFGSPMPFFTQSFADHRSARNNENCISLPQQK